MLWQFVLFYCSILCHHTHLPLFIHPIYFVVLAIISSCVYSCTCIRVGTHIHSFLFSFYIGVELLFLRVCIYSTSVDDAKWFTNYYTNRYSHLQCVRVRLIKSYPMLGIVKFYFPVLVIVAGMFYLALICFS